MFAILNIMLSWLKMLSKCLMTTRDEDQMDAWIRDFVSGSDQNPQPNASQFLYLSGSSLSRWCLAVENGCCAPH